MRGVMEKCTFCVQRIEQAKIERKAAFGASGDVILTEAEGTIPKVACQQACPAGAIVFGLLGDPQSQVSHEARGARSMQLLLEELGTQPKVVYLKALRAQGITPPVQED
jgi:molybdopterin-containing oxidoreductase family iron-sulfur binding subunit